MAWKLARAAAPLFCAFAFTALRASAATPLITFNIPVSLSNIDRSLDSFSVNCQLHGKSPLGAQTYSNAEIYNGKLVNRGFTGTVAVVYSADAAFAQTATDAVCQLGLYSTTNPQLGYRPGTDLSVPDKYQPKPGAPFTGIITIKL